MWLVWFLFSTHWFSIWNAIIVAVCNNIVLFVRLQSITSMQFSAITSYALTSILSVFCLWSMLQLFSCSQVWQPLLSSFPVSSSLWSPCCTISCRYRLFPLLLAFGWSVTKHKRARRNRVVVSFLALEEIMSYVSFSMHLPVFNALKK